jgi:opacity protein-like surface antigen
VTLGAFEAYGGIGLGATHLRISSGFGGTGAAGMVNLGVRYAISSNIKLFTEARYFSTLGSVRIKSTPPQVDDRFDNASLVIGVRTSF